MWRYMCCKEVKVDSFCCRSNHCYNCKPLQGVSGAVDPFLWRMAHRVELECLWTATMMLTHTFLCPKFPSTLDLSHVPAKVQITGSLRQMGISAHSAQAFCKTSWNNVRSNNQNNERENAQVTGRSVVGMVPTNSHSLATTHSNSCQWTSCCL